jgi:S-(hydroxymethyl)glutathione dehydrogenase / alcohol dehydrogenase
MAARDRDASHAGMKAAVLEEQGKPVRVRDDVEIADPGPGQVRVRVHACGICHSDLSIVDGAFPSALPVVLGHEAAGVVEKLGAGVDGLAEGDHVVLTPVPPCGTCYWCVRSEPGCCVNTAGLMTSSFPDGATGLRCDGQTVWRGVNMAGFAEKVLVPATGAVKVPSDLPLEVLCVIGCAVQTGVGAVLNTAKVEEGATVLIMGLGGIGLSAVQGARLAGAARIIVSDPVAERREIAGRFGATDFIDPTAEDVIQRTHALTGVGADYAFETAGRASLAQTGLFATRPGGTTVCVGAPPISEGIEFAPASVFVIQEKKLLGCTLGSSNSLREIPRLVALWQAGRLDLESMITARRPLAAINDGLADLRASRGVRTVLSIA